MQQRRLGKNGPLVSAIGLGRGSQPVQFDTPLEKEFNDTIHRAIDLGINLFDSSDAYWGTRHEVLLGRALKGRRDKALIATKFGNIDLPDGRKAPNAKPEYVVQCCEASLKRLDEEGKIPTLPAGTFKGMSFTLDVSVAGVHVEEEQKYAATVPGRVCCRWARRELERAVTITIAITIAITRRPLSCLAIRALWRSLFLFYIKIRLTFLCLRL